MKIEELAYAAGIFDGEGSVHMTGHSGIVRVSVTNTDKRVIDYFKERWEGNILSQTTPNHKAMYRWILHSRKAIPFLRDILPYLIIKEEVVNLALQHIGTTYKPDQGKLRAELSQKIYSCSHPLMVN